MSDKIKDYSSIAELSEKLIRGEGSVNKLRKLIFAERCKMLSFYSDNDYEKLLELNNKKHDRAFFQEIFDLFECVIIMNDFMFYDLALHLFSTPNSKRTFKEIKKLEDNYLYRRAVKIADEVIKFNNEKYQTALNDYHNSADWIISYLKRFDFSFDERLLRKPKKKNKEAVGLW